MLKFLSIIFGGLLISNSFALTPQNQLESKDYTILSVPVPKTQTAGGKVDVKEFFSYTCIHCKDIEPLIESTIMLDKNIDFNKIQVVWSDQADITGFAKLNATIQALKLQKLNVPAFNAIFSNQNLNEPKILRTFLGQNGLKSTDIDDFIATYNSFAISGKVGEYKNLTKVYNITGTPTFIIADKYIASPALPQQLVLVVQALIKKASQEGGIEVPKKPKKAVSKSKIHPATTTK
jgi:thiol:disulfide interchange protein DsbA